MTLQSRHVDEGLFLYSLADEVWVKCARCQFPGLVSAKSGDRRWLASFECEECKLTLDSTRGDWVGPIMYTGRRPCGHCGHQWLQPRIRQTDWPREVISSMEACCEACNRNSVVDLSGHAFLEGADCRDPHFGMPLWLVDAGRHGPVWAYNAAHLRVLKAFVSATLRERSQNAGNASLISRLPGWMKEAKNRDAVTKRLIKLERQLAERSGRSTAEG